MTHDRHCPRCGRPLPPDARHGACPACLLRAGLELGSGAAPLDASNGDEVTLGFDSTSPGRVLESLARSIGSIPRVLLPDTQNDDRDVPVIKPSSPEMPAPSERGDRYQLFGEIARGGMGAVLKGRDPDLGRDVAVKVLLEGHRYKHDLLRRFLEEAQIGGQLQHPGIVPVYEMGTFAEGRPYFTMKLIKGRTLAELLKERGSPRDDLPRFLGVFEQVCQTVAYAHARGVIHRDLKPTNIMLGSFGEVQVMDWGLAKVLREGSIADKPPPPEEPAPAVSVIQTVRSGSDVDASQAGSALGTPAYMAPEQAGGDVDHVDRRTDVFGLGSILCEILTGQPAYTGRSQAEVMREAMRGETGDALARLDGCGAEGELSGLARECLAAEAEDRPRDAGVVARRIAGYLAGVQERLRRAERERAVAEERAVGERRRRQLQGGLAAAILALVGVGAAGAWVLARQQADRIAATTRLVDDALGKAADLRGRALAAPADDLTGWDEARTQTRRAEDALAQGVADDVLRGRVAAARAELERLRAEAERRAEDAAAERRLVTRLTQIRIVNGLDRYNPRGALRESVAALREFGVDIEALVPERAGAALAGRPATGEMVAALDEILLLLEGTLPADGSTFPATYVDSPTYGRLLEVNRATDPDPWRDGLRALLARPRAEWTAGLKRLAADHDSLDRQSAHGLRLLAGMLNRVGERVLADEVYQAAWRRAPDDFWHNWTLGMASWEDDVGLTRPAEALRFLSVAVALRPDNYRARLNMGNALRGAGDLAQAIAVFRELIRRYPRENAAYIALADTLRDQGALAEAEAVVRAALREEQGFRRKYDLVWAHRLLALILKEQGKAAGAEAECREAIRLDPADAEAHNTLAAGLLEWGDLAGAAQSNHEALRLWPGLGVARATRAKLLVVRGRFAEAVPDLERAAARLAATGDRKGSAACRDLLARARRLAEHIDALKALAAPDERDGKQLTALGLAALARAGNRPALTARLYEVVLTASPGRAGDLKTGHRLAAARAAAHAGSGGGRDEPSPDDAERAALRRLALGWLRDELAARKASLRPDDPASRAAAAEALRGWRSDPDLAGVRAPEALAKLPADEQQACRKLWAEADALLAQLGRP